MEQRFRSPFRNWSRAINFVLLVLFSCTKLMSDFFDCRFFPMCALFELSAGNQGCWARVKYTAHPNSWSPLAQLNPIPVMGKFDYPNAFAYPFWVIRVAGAQNWYPWYTIHTHTQIIIHTRWCSCDHCARTHARSNISCLDWPLPGWYRDNSCPTILARQFLPDNSCPSIHFLKKFWTVFFIVLELLCDLFGTFSGSLLDFSRSFWDFFRINLGLFRDHFGTFSGSFWDFFGIILGLYWDFCGNILGLYWDRFRAFLVLFLDPFEILQKLLSSLWDFPKWSRKSPEKITQKF